VDYGPEWDTSNLSNNASHVSGSQPQWKKTMIKFIEGLPQDVMAIEATGKVTHEDYRDTLIPKAEAMMGKGPIRMLYVIGPECTGFEVEALWDDGKLGFRHWHDFSQIALVSDLTWVRASVNIFKPFFHCDVRLFSDSELAAAKDWITNAK
jgi:hypothetical protein